MRFLDGDLDFDADTTEEKYTICRLLDLILEAENAGKPVRSLNGTQSEEALLAPVDRNRMGKKMKKNERRLTAFFPLLIYALLLLLLFLLLLRPLLVLLLLLLLLLESTFKNSRKTWP